MIFNSFVTSCDSALHLVSYFSSMVTNKLVKTFIKCNEHPFVMLSIFFCAAKQQGWTDHELYLLRKKIYGLKSEDIEKVLRKYLK